MTIIIGTPNFIMGDRNVMYGDVVTNKVCKLKKVGDDFVTGAAGPLAEFAMYHSVLDDPVNSGDFTFTDLECITLGSNGKLLLVQRGYLLETMDDFLVIGSGEAVVRQIVKTWLTYKHGADYTYLIQQIKEVVPIVSSDWDIWQLSDGIFTHSEVII